MAMLSSPALLASDVVIDGRRYPLAWDIGDRKGLAWRRVGADNEQVIDSQIVSEQWGSGWQGGIGEVVRRSRVSNGYPFSDNMDASGYGFTRIAERRFTVTPTNAPTDSPAYFFEQGSAIFCVVGRRGYRMTVDGAGAITVTHEVDFGASAVAGRPDKFEGTWYIPLGASVDFVSVSAPATFGTTAANGSMRALAFATYQDGSTARFARGYSTNLVALTAADPLVVGNWGSGFEYGDSSDAITSMVDTGVMLCVAKVDNLYLGDATGANIPIFNFGRGTGDATNGVGLVAIPGTEIALYNHQSGLHLLMGNSLRLNVGPDGIEYNQSIPNVSLEPYLGRHYEAVVYGDWVYSLYRVVESGTTRTYVLAGKIINVLNMVVWHTPFLETAAARGAFVDSSQRLWTVSGSTIVYRQLGQSGSPDAGRDTLGRGAASSTFRMYIPTTDFGYPNTLKQLQRVRISGRNIDATTPITVQVSRDGAAVENTGISVTASGITSRWWTPGTNDTCFHAMLLLEINTTAAYAPTTGDPQIWMVGIDAWLRPDKAELIHFVVDCGAPLSNDAEQDSPPSAVRTALIALEGGASVTVYDPYGLSRNLNILKVSDLEMHQLEDGGWTCTIEVIARERVIVSFAEILDNGAAVGNVESPTTWEIYDNGVLIGSTTSVDTVEIYDNGVLIGSASI